MVTEKDLVKVITFYDDMAVVTLKARRSLKQTDFLVKNGLIFQFRAWKKDAAIVAPVQTVELVR